MQPNDWNQYKRLLLYEMKQNGKRFEKVTDILTDLQIQISALKVKAAVAGGMAGIVGTGLVSLILKLWR